MGSPNTERGRRCRNERHEHELTAVDARGVLDRFRLLLEIVLDLAQ
jgi:hypothetical protein